MKLHLYSPNYFGQETAKGLFDLQVKLPPVLLSCFSKILEKLAYTRIIYFLNHENVLLPNPYGFRRNLSFSHAVINILSTCYDNVEKKLYSGLILHNFAKAFDTVDHYILVQKLDHFGLREIVNESLKSFLKADVNLLASITLILLDVI